MIAGEGLALPEAGRDPRRTVQQCILLSGRPGSGKTTALWHVVAALCVLGG